MGRRKIRSVETEKRHIASNVCIRERISFKYFMYGGEGGGGWGGRGRVGGEHC